MVEKASDDLPVRCRPRSSKLKRVLTYPPSALLIYLLYGLMALLPPEKASAVGGYLGRYCGRWLRSRNRVAFKNLALLERDPARRKRILEGMWEHLGRVAGEYPHLRALGRKLAQEIVLEQPLGKPGKPCVLCSAHVGNWELLLPTLHALGYRDLCSLYRRPNNPFVHWLVRHIRKLESYKLLASDQSGIKTLFKSMDGGHWAAMLIDQKRDGGIASPFLGREAMTTTLPARLALRYGCGIGFFCLLRLEGVRFRAQVEWIEIGDTDDVQQLTDRLNRRLEDLVRRYPEQWLWIHRRWSD